MHCWQLKLPIHQLKLPIHQNGPLLASYCYLLFFVEWYLGIWCEEPRTWAFCAVGVKLIHFCTVGSCKLQTCIAVMGAKLRITSQVLTYYLAWNLKAPLIRQCFSMFFLLFVYCRIIWMWNSKKQGTATCTSLRFAHHGPSVSDILLLGRTEC